jgi:[protein-PII] uridylyltransferase
MYFSTVSAGDVLTLNRQERFADSFGYRSSRGALAVELFMQDYYAHAAELHRFFTEMLRLGGLAKKQRWKDDVVRGGKVDRGLRIANRRVYIPARDVNWFRENPARLLEIIWYSQKQGLTLSGSAMFKMKANLELIDDHFRESPVAREYFMAILSDTQRAGSGVRLMNDIGILDRYLPEFAAVKNAVRYYPFHQHPVNEHTLRALESLAAIPQLTESGANALKKIIAEVKTPELISLAILLHDLGKIEEGSHTEAGIRIARSVGARLALDAEQMQTLEFLIRNHLNMVHLSQSRDLEDENVIKAFASEIGTEERLNMLYVLTFADLYAVRESAWNDWISALLYQLYSTTRYELVHAPSPEQKHVKYWNTPKGKAVCEYSKDSSDAKNHLRRMSPRYLASFSPEEIAQHIRMVASLHKRKSVLKCGLDTDYAMSNVTVCTWDRPGLLADIVGTFASQHVSVLSAAVFTRSDGVAIDSFHVVDGTSDRPISSMKWSVVKDNLRRVLRGERSVEDLIRNAERNPRIAQNTMFSLRRGIYFDNKISATHTVIDVEAPDRIGLLYDITSVFFDLGLDLSVARVVTDVRQARDAFYVTDGNGRKITDALRIQEIRERIEKVVNADVQRDECTDVNDTQ